MTSASKPLPARLRKDQPLRPNRSSSASQGESVAVWGMWAVLLGALAVTYTRLDPTELYHVSRNGFSGGMSRVLVEMNYPLSLVAIALILISLDVLPTRWWWVGGPAIALGALTAWPGVVDDADLDARPINALPAMGVGLALLLTVAAVKKTGPSLAPRRPLDIGRLIIGGVVLLLSLPWIAADIGIFLPDGVFIMERPITSSDGNVAQAVHLGHHHGLDGSLILLSALLLSRVKIRSAKLAVATTSYVSLMFAYGGAICAQDFWNEQLVKRDWVDWEIPYAVKPSLAPVWLFILLMTAGTYWLIQTYDHRRQR